jgi:hypothetical protein
LNGRLEQPIPSNREIVKNQQPLFDINHTNETVLAEKVKSESSSDSDSPYIHDLLKQTETRQLKKKEANDAYSGQRIQKFCKEKRRQVLIYSERIGIKKLV